MSAARILGASLLLLVAACSGAAETDLLGQPGDTAANDQTSTSVSPNDPSADPGPSTNSPASPTAPAPNNPTTPPKADDPKDPPGGQPPAPACAVEVEGNNSAENAIAFSGCMKGALQSRSDVDFYKVVAPKGAKVMHVDHTETNGKVLYRVTQENGIPIIGTTMFTEEAPEIQVQGGATYLFRLGWTNQGGGGERPYEFTVEFE